MPFPLRIKATLIRMAVFPKGLYGIEAAPCTMAKLQKLRTVVLRIIGPNSTLRSLAMVFAASADGDDLDPIAQTASLRTTTLRRYLAWYPHFKKKANVLLTHYLKQKEEDGEESAQQPTDTEDEEDEIPERKLRKKTKFKPRGPIGLLVAAMALNGLQVGVGFEILYATRGTPPAFYIVGFGSLQRV